MAIGCLLALMLVPTAVLSSDLVSEQAASNAANPVRKVVTMLQMMVKKVEAEGVTEQELFDKYMCYCDNADETLGKSIADSDTKIPQLGSDIKVAEENKAQLELDLKQHQTDRDSAKEAMAQATEMREKEAAAYAAERAETEATIAAITKAVAALEKGMYASGFLQSNVAQVLRKLVVSRPNMLNIDREDLTSFLSGSQHDGYAPASGEIVGILKQLGDEMAKDLAETIAAEEKAIVMYDELMAAKKAEVEACTKAIEEKLVRVGELGVEIAQMKNDLTDSEEALIEDTKFLADLGKNCALKKKEWDVRCKTRSEELVALADTIKILNDDDALELFKKTLPSASFVQVQESAMQVRARALSFIKAGTMHKSNALSLDFIALALHGKKAGFEKVIKLIDEMTVTLKKEQQDDDHKKEFCGVQFDLADDKKKELERGVSDNEKAIAEAEDGLATVKDELAALEAGIVELDKSVAVATEQRKKEHEESTASMAANGAAKELILFAKNRMQKFYNPKLYKPPPKRELTEEERITLNMGGTLAPTNAPGGIAGTGIGLVQKKDAPAPPPEASFGGKKTEESGGVMAMMDMMVADLDKEITEGTMEEKDGQEDYEKYMQDCSDKRSGDSKAITDRQGAMAQMETELQAHNDGLNALNTELTATKDYIQTLHADCDFLLAHYGERKEARANEIDAMQKAKAVLNGADYSLVQTSRHVSSHA